MSRRTRINLYSLFIAILLLVLSICYAQVLNGILEVKGKAEGKAQEGVFITEVEYYANNGVDTANSAVDQITGTALKSSVILGANESSSYTYKVTMHNNTDREYVFIGVVANKTDPNTYSNTNIDYSVESVTGLNGLEEYFTIIEPGEYIIFPVTFKYAGTDTSNPLLNSLLNFRFREVPILELSNVGETYTLENIGAGHVEEYEFTVSNYNQEYNNGVPLTYAFETVFSEGCPLEAKIYDEDGVEVTGNIQISGDKTTQEDHTYTLKLTWDSSLTSTEYQGKSYNCTVNLVATPDVTVDAELAEYAEYSIEKEFGINITTNIRPTLEVTVSDITSTSAKITAVGNDGDGDNLQYTLEINGQTYTSDTGIFEVTELGTGKTYQYTVSVTDGYETVTAEEQLTTECINYVPEYIESTGTQYIDTGIVAKSGLSSEIGISISTLSDSTVLGAANSTGRILLLHVNPNGFIIGSGDYWRGGTIASETMYDAVTSLKVGRQELIINGETVILSNATSSINLGINLFLFARNQADSPQYYTKSKIYYCKIYDGETLVRDFIPALDESGVACLYDKVTKQYFYNSGTGTFNYEMIQVGHIFGIWEVTTPPTCIATGIETRTCTVCGTTETQEIPADTENGHNFVDGVCTLCGKTQNTAPVITTNADYKSGKTTNKFTIQMNATDVDGDNLTYKLYASTSQNGTYYQVGTTTGAAGTAKTIAATAINGIALTMYTDYWWYIEVTDGIETVKSDKQKLKTYCSGSTSTCSDASVCPGSVSTSRCQDCNGTR